MSQLQMFFSQAEETKHKMRELRMMYREALEQSQEYADLTEKIKTMRERRKQIEFAIKQDFEKELEKLDDCRIDLSASKQSMSDAALTMLMKSETVEVTDEFNNFYDPIFKVSFKKRD